MAQSHAALQTANGFFPREIIANKPQAFFGMKAPTIIRHDPGGLLAPVLQGVKPKGGKGGGIIMAKNAEHAAFFAKRVTIHVEVECIMRHGLIAFLIARWCFGRPS